MDSTKQAHELAIAELKHTLYGLESKLELRDAELVSKTKALTDSLTNQKAKHEEQLQLANERLADKTDAFARVSFELQAVCDELKQQKCHIHDIEAELGTAKKAVDEAQILSQSHMEETMKLKSLLETEQTRARELEKRARSIDVRYKEGDLVRQNESVCVTYAKLTLA